MKSKVSTQNPKFKPTFMGFTLQLKDDVDHQETLDDVKIYMQEYPKLLAVLKEFLSCIQLNSNLLEITIRSDLSIGEAWDLTYKLQREIKQVIFAEPRFALVDLTDGCGTYDIQSISRDQVAQEKISFAKQNNRWHLDQIKYTEALQKFRAKHGEDKLPGEGITIALPDSAALPDAKYLTDSELLSYLENNKVTVAEKAMDYYEDDRGFITPQTAVGEVRLNQPFPVTFWHGVATASLIIGLKGDHISKGENPISMTGVVPGAKLKPYRLGPTSFEFEFFTPTLAKAISDIAAYNETPNLPDEEKVRVISLSLGGYPSLAVRQAIINVQRKGIIVIAAAGNGVSFAGWPAAYDSVIAVASSTVDRKIANSSALGNRIDVAAPGEYVCVPILINKHGQPSYDIQPRVGTSYAAPLVAGVAALWLSYHGWSKLASDYGPARIPLVFDKLLRQTCSQPKGWDTNNWGAGIVNAERLLSARLPDVDDFYIQEPLAYREVDHVRLDRGGIETFIHLFEKTLCSADFLEGISIQVSGNSILNNLITKEILVRSSLANEIRLDIALWTLRKFLDISLSSKGLRVFLRTFGREIAFHLGTDFILYQLVDNALKKAVGLPVDSEDDLRDALGTLKEVASDYLRDNLEKYGMRS